VICPRRTDESRQIDGKINFFQAREFNFAKNSSFLGRARCMPTLIVGNPALFGICLANNWPLASITTASGAWDF
jgi:hypothetical protein